MRSRLLDEIASQIKNGTLPCKEIKNTRYRLFEAWGLMTRERFTFTTTTAARRQRPRVQFSYRERSHRHCARHLALI